MNISETKDNIMQEKLKKAYVYTRNSDVASFDRGSSKETQIAKCKSYAVIHNLDIVEIHEEQVSGGRDFKSRKVFSNMFENAERNSVIIVSRLDRLSRSCYFTLQLLEDCKSRNIEIHTTDLGCINGEGMGRIFFLIMSVFSESERLMIKERVSATKSRMRKQGRFLGGKNQRFGMKIADDGKHYVEDEKEQKILNRIFHLRDKKIGYRQISKNILDEYNRKIHFSHICKLVNRESENLVTV